MPEYMFEWAFVGWLPVIHGMVVSLSETSLPGTENHRNCYLKYWEQHKGGWLATTFCLSVFLLGLVVISLSVRIGQSFSLMGGYRGFAEPLGWTPLSKTPSTILGRPEEPQNGPSSSSPLLLMLPPPTLCCGAWKVPPSSLIIQKGFVLGGCFKGRITVTIIP